MVDFLETLMLIAFSVGWYYSIAKMLRTGRASGKSIGFVCLVCLGYLCGILAKITAFQQTGDLSAVVYIYGWNFLVTAFDAVLVVILTRRERHGTPAPGTAQGFFSQGFQRRFQSKG